MVRGCSGWDKDWRAAIGVSAWFHRGSVRARVASADRGCLDEPRALADRRRDAPTFVDPTGDNEAAWRPTSADRAGREALGPSRSGSTYPTSSTWEGDFLALFLDTDLNPATGSRPPTAATLHPGNRCATAYIDHLLNGKLWDFARPRPHSGPSGRAGPTITVHRSELGATRGFSFWIGASWSRAAPGSSSSRPRRDVELLTRASARRVGRGRPSGP